MDDDISHDLDAAMLVRREGLAGADTPDGILTRIRGSVAGDLITNIETVENPITVNLGFTLLEMNEESIEQLSKGISQVTELARADKKHHDFTIGLGSAGITVHCNNDSEGLARARLADHCERRKYMQKADKWFGLCIAPNPKITIRFGLALEFPWEESAEMTRLLAPPTLLPKGPVKQSERKTGRNERCPCGSGEKFKNCCLRKS